MGEQYIEEWSKLGFVVNFLRFLELILVDEFFQSSSLCFWVKNLKNTNKELSEEHTCERGAPGDLKRGQAGRPRAMGPAGLGCSWPSSTSSFSGDPGAISCLCPVHLLCFAPSKTHAPLLPCPCCPLATLFLHFVSFTLSHTSSFITWCHLC